MQELITTGKTVAEAVETACEQLGLSSDDVVYEILEEAHGGFLGIGAKPARVKAWPREDEISGKSLLEEMDKPKPQPAEQPRRDERRENQSGRGEQRRPERPKNTAPQRESYPFKSEPAKAAETVKEPAPVKEHAPQPAAEPEQAVALAELPASAAKALEYLRGIAPMLGASEIEYSAVKTERGVKLVLDGEDASAIIGRRGETMDALQYLCTLVSSRAGDEYCKISLDVAGYRQKREKTLQALAQREAARVKKTKYSATLDPMNPYERRIVHSAVQLIEGVTSESVGEEPYRRVVISLVSGGKTSHRDSQRGRFGKGGSSRGGGKGYDRPRRDGDRDRQGGYRRDDERKSEPRESAPAAKAADKPAAEKKSESAGTLYAKIEL